MYDIYLLEVDAIAILDALLGGDKSSPVSLLAFVDYYYLQRITISAEEG